MNRQPRYQPGGRIAGRYEVHQVLMGGMGEVYLCLDLEEMYPLALKTFQQRYQIDARRLRQAFEQEVATWVALEKHPNIVRCFYMDVLDNQPFMVLEWIAGEEGRGTALRDWLRCSPLDLRHALDFTIDICRGLLHAQEKQPGLVHRDLKPENVLIAHGELAKITDFGLAQIVQEAGLEASYARGETDQHQSLWGQADIVGTPAYMAPEQWRGEALDVRTDIYAVGCILHEMLTGRRVFEANTLDGLRRQHLERAIPRLMDGQALPRSLNSLLTRCLAKRREDRFINADSLLEQLEIIYQQQFAESPKPDIVSKEFTVEDYCNRGATYNHLHRYHEALLDYTRAIHLDPSSAIAHTGRGATHHNMCHYDKALEDHTYAIQLNPELAQTYSNRGNTYLSLHRYREALADLDQAIQVDPTSIIAFSNRGAAYAGLHQYERALIDYKRALELDPIDAATYAARGAAYIELHCYDEALADLTYAIQLDPSLALAYTNRGVVYEKQGRFEEALIDHTQAIRIDRACSVAYNNRGVIYESMQSYDKALSDYTQAIQLDPLDAMAYTNRGLVYAKLQRYNEALADFTQTIKCDPTYAKAYASRGLAYRKLQQHHEALADFNRAIQFDPSSAHVYTNRGNTYGDLERFDEALADFNQAIQLDPTDAPAYFNAGAVLANLGNWREALPYFERAAQCGIPQGAQCAEEARQKLGIEAAPGPDPTQRALEAFRKADSLDEMRGVVKEFLFMTDINFITAVQSIMEQDVSSHHVPAFDQRMAWLRQIANEEKELNR